MKLMELFKMGSRPVAWFVAVGLHANGAETISRIQWCCIPCGVGYGSGRREPERLEMGYNWLGHIGPHGPCLNLFCNWKWLGDGWLDLWIGTISLRKKNLNGSSSLIALDIIIWFNLVNFCWVLGYQNWNELSLFWTWGPGWINMREEYMSPPKNNWVVKWIELWVWLNG